MPKSFEAPASKYTGKIKINRTAGSGQTGPVPLPQWRAPLKRSEAKRDLQPGQKRGPQS